MTTFEANFVAKLEKANGPNYTEDCVIIRNTWETSDTGDGYKIVQFKTGGLNKGEHVLATVCGGNMGKVLALAIAKQAMEMTMIDILVSEVL